MNRKNTKLLACAVALILLTNGAAITASAAGSDTSHTYESESYSGRDYKELPTVKNKNVWSYTRPKLMLQGKSVAIRGIIISGTYYVPFKAAADALGAKYSYAASTRTATMSLGALTLISSDGCYTSYANDRALFSAMPSMIMSDGRLYIPLDIFLKSTGLTSTKNSSNINISGSFKPILHASKFYREDEVLWLARIIHAESRGEPLLGQIAVGNVVLNRVRASAFPNTIYSVIFDKKYGVQFSPTINGAIYNTPSYSATLAAKICLDGFDTSEGALYFLQPKLSTSSWIPKNRPYAFTIGGHDFYK